MGQLVDGVWHTGWYEPDKKGAFNRPAARFRDRAPAVEAGRYHLYVSTACPWAHRTMITRSLRGLTHAISMTVVDPKMGDEGWSFREPDPVLGATLMQHVYLKANPTYTGRVTVPVLWDTQKGTIVNNESREIMRMLDVEFAPLSKDALVDTLAPPSLVGEIDKMIDANYEAINNGVYRCGFAGSQEAYDKAVRELFDRMFEVDALLGRQKFLCGDVMTEADVALFTTMIRFDLVYYSHFKTNLKRLRDLPNLWRFTRRMYQQPGIASTCDLADMKVHYYWSQTTVNPNRVVPIGPDLEPELLAPVDD